jgi:hypothetical protein
MYLTTQLYVDDIVEMVSIKYLKIDKKLKCVTLTITIKLLKGK